MLGHIGLPEKPEARWEWMMARISQRQMNTLFQIAYEILKNKDDTDDVISESLVIAAEKLHKLKDPDKLFSWLYAIVRHEALDYYQKNTVRRAAIETMLQRSGSIASNSAESQYYHPGKSSAGARSRRSPAFPGQRDRADANCR